jgi:hypothetical protein
MVMKSYIFRRLAGVYRIKGGSIKDALVPKAQIPVAEAPLAYHASLWLCHRIWN